MDQEILEIAHDAIRKMEFGAEQYLLKYPQNKNSPSFQNRAKNIDAMKLLFNQYHDMRAENKRLRVEIEVVQNEYIRAIRRIYTIMTVHGGFNAEYLADAIIRRVDDDMLHRLIQVHSPALEDMLTVAVQNVDKLVKRRAGKRLVKTKTV